MPGFRGRGGGAARGLSAGRTRWACYQARYSFFLGVPAVMAGPRAGHLVQQVPCQMTGSATGHDGLPVLPTRHLRVVAHVIPVQPYCAQELKIDRGRRQRGAGVADQLRSGLIIILV